MKTDKKIEEVLGRNGILTKTTPLHYEIKREAEKEIKRKAKIVFDQPFGTPRIDWGDNPLSQQSLDKEK